MRVECPGCSGLLEVDDEFAGRVVACPHCSAQMQAPARTVVEAPPPQSYPEPTKQCPFCGETILRVARKCKHCREEITEAAPDPDALRARLRVKETRLREQLASGGMPEIPWSVGGVLRVRTVVGAVLTAGAILIGAAMIMLGDSDVAPLSAVAFIVAFVALICTLVAFTNDMRTPCASSRTTPLAGIRAFLHSLRLGRFAYAYACVLESDKDDNPRRRKGFGALKTNPGTFSLGQLAGFKAYWKDIVRPGGGHNRRMTISSLALEQEEADWALVRIHAKLEAYPSAVLIAVIFGVPGIILAVVLAYATTKREHLSIVKLMRRVDDQWYVLNGELDSPEDRAMALALEVSQET